VVAEASRHPLQHRFVIETAVAPPGGGTLDDPAESPGIVRDRVADLVQCRPRRHPDPRPDKGLPGLEMEIQPGPARLGVAAHPMVGRAVPEPARRVRLVRRLVLGKANVAIDPEHRALRIAGQLGGKPGEAHVHLLDQRPHRHADLRLVVVPMRLEPRLLVVAGEAAEKPQRRGGKYHRDRNPQRARATSYRYSTYDRTAPSIPCTFGFV